MNNEKKINVLFATSEVAPFVKTGGLGDVAGALPKNIKKFDVDIRVIMPLYSFISNEYKMNLKKECEFYVPLSWRQQYCAIYSLNYDNIIYYFVDNEYYFKKDYPYGYFDDGERMGYFSKAILECLQYLDFNPDIIHLNDWHTAISAVYLREMYRGIKKYDHIKTIITIHNIKFQGLYSPFVLDDILGLGIYKNVRDQIFQGEYIDLLRGGLNYTDYITTVSPSYANEIKTEEFGEYLQDVIVRRADIVKGILNGIDYDYYNPKTDNNIYANYDINNLDKKYENKIKLQKELGLNIDKNAPLFCIVSRLTEQKGIDFIMNIFEEFMNSTNAQFVILGVGDKNLEDGFKYFANKYNERVSSNQLFSESLSKKIYAASDMIVIPSRFEPCGLTQMIAMRYLTVPIVRFVGGLKDTVKSFNENTNEGNGFGFDSYNSYDLLNTMKYSTYLYNEKKEIFNKIIKNDSETFFTWEVAAKEYIKIYERLLNY